MDLDQCAVEDRGCGWNRWSGQRDRRWHHRHWGWCAANTIGQHAQLCGLGGRGRHFDYRRRLLLVGRPETSCRDGTLMAGGHLLTILIFFPVVGALALLILRGDDRKWIRGFAFGIAVAEFVLSLGLLWQGRIGPAGY